MFLKHDFRVKNRQKCSQVNAFLTVCEHRCEHFFWLTQGLFSRTIGSYKRPLKAERASCDKYGGDSLFSILLAQENTSGTLAPA
jgi:hypothetical protein